VVVAEVGTQREDLAPAGRAAGVDGGRGEHDEAIPVRLRVGALVPRGRRQHAAEGPPSARPAGVLVGEGDDGDAEAGIRQGVGEGEEVVSGVWQTPAAVCVGAAEERGEVPEEEDEKESEREEEEEPWEAEVVKVAGGAARPGPHGHRREWRLLAVACSGASDGMPGAIVRLIKDLHCIPTFGQQNIPSRFKISLHFKESNKSKYIKIYNIYCNNK